MGWLRAGPLPLGLAALLSCTPPGATGSPTHGPRDTPTGAATDTSVVTSDAPQVLVIPNRTGLSFLSDDGSLATATWTALVGSCDTCGGEGASVDTDGGLLLSFTLHAPVSNGGIARLDPTGALDFRLDGFLFPHDAVRDPLDGTLVVEEASGNRLTWIAGDGGSAVAVRTLSTIEDPSWPGNTPNGLTRFDHDGHSYLLASHRGVGALPGTGDITLWDISAATPSFVWQFPATGAGLGSPHGPVFRELGGQWWLLWAHTEGAPVGSSVGLAVTDDPSVLPQYVADLVPTAPIGPLGFARGVELSAGGMLYITDSGGGVGGGPPTGRVVLAPMPTGLVPTGATGAVDQDQVLVDLPDGVVVADGLDNPFEGWLWVPSFAL